MRPRGDATAAASESEPLDFLASTALPTVPEARETARLATAGTGVLIGLWAMSSALRA